jgi:hypothetical protein
MCFRVGGGHAASQQHGIAVFGVLREFFDNLAFAH